MDPQPNNAPQPAQQPAAPTQRIAPDPIVANPGMPVNPPAPVQQPTTPTGSANSGMFVPLIVLCALFCIPAAIGVKVYHDKYKASVQVGDADGAKKYLTTMKLWGFIGPALAILLFIVSIAASGK